MAESFNERIGFLLLDDVINSFDVEHRGRLAELLADGFGAWQLDRADARSAVLRAPEPTSAAWRKLDSRPGATPRVRGPRTTKRRGFSAVPRSGSRTGTFRGRDQGAARPRRASAGSLRGALGPALLRRGQANDKREIGELFKESGAC